MKDLFGLKVVVSSAVPKGLAFLVAPPGDSEKMMFDWRPGGSTMTLCAYAEELGRPGVCCKCRLPRARHTIQVMLDGLLHPKVEVTMGTTKTFKGYAVRWRSSAFQNESTLYFVGTDKTGWSNNGQLTMDAVHLHVADLLRRVELHTRKCEKAGTVGSPWCAGAVSYELGEVFAVESAAPTKYALVIDGSEVVDIKFDEGRVDVRPFDSAADAWYYFKTSILPGRTTAGQVAVKPLPGKQTSTLVFEKIAS
jgi:hypothetical protein